MSKLTNNFVFRSCKVTGLPCAAFALEGVPKNSEFAQMPRKGTPIRYGQKQPVWNHQQGEENKVSVQGNL